MEQLTNILENSLWHPVDLEMVRMESSIYELEHTEERAQQ